MTAVQPIPVTPSAHYQMITQFVDTSDPEIVSLDFSKQPDTEHQENKANHLWHREDVSADQLPVYISGDCEGLCWSVLDYKDLSSHQKDVQLYKSFRCDLHQGQEEYLAPRYERKFVRIFRSNPATSKAQACYEMEIAGTPVSLLTVKQGFLHHGLRGCQPWKKPLLHLQARLKFGGWIWNG